MRFKCHQFEIRPVEVPPPHKNANLSKSRRTEIIKCMFGPRTQKLPIFPAVNEGGGGDTFWTERVGGGVGCSKKLLKAISRNRDYDWRSFYLLAKVISTFK